ncbi:mediator of RNA polymerase II transcription subunit 1-domain-containing protein [Delphinella strobiligena]|nr:mediator of RNA polymerase II transcription subunit 1-domain-containing protein [Delphinella strobiligena]
MNTPNANQQQQHSNKHLQSYATHAVSTPNHHHTPGATTTPRSVPSPAIPRPGTASSFSAKFPSSSHPSSSTIGTPQNASGKHNSTWQGSAAMAPSLSQMSNTSNNSQTIGLGVTNGLMGASPANLLSFTSPAALAALDIGTPSALLGGEAGQAMSVSLSDLGISSRRGNEDEERRAKLESVLAKLQGRSKGRDDVRRAGKFGRVSEEGLRRVACWVGMEVDADDKHNRGFDGNRIIHVAGTSSVIMDFPFKNNVPGKVVVAFFSEDDAVTAHQEAAAAVFMKDLEPPPGVLAINASLDRFAANLETIAKLDKLSVAGKLNCLEAITGIYTALRRLYEQEKNAALELFEAKGEAKDAFAATEVTCKRSGRPRMHARRKIGLSVEYWMERRHLSRSKAENAVQKSDGSMDIDAKTSDGDSDDDDDKGIYTLHLTAEANDPSLYPSLRNTKAWISDRIHVPSAETTSPSALLSGNPSIDWQDPPPTYLDSSSDDQADSMNVDSNHQQSQKLPSVRFVAKLDPPLAMPWNVANNILQSVGAQAGTDVDVLQTYTSILLRRSPSASVPANSLDTLGAVEAVASAEKKVLRAGGEEVSHRRELWVPKQEFGYVLRSIPFAHPRQIVQILPVLRQWAQLGSLMQNSFLPETDSNQSSTVPSTKTSQQFNQVVDKEESQKKKTYSLAELLVNLDGSSDQDIEMSGQDDHDHDHDHDRARTREQKQWGDAEPLPIDLSLTTTPSPSLDVVFPLSRLEGGLASISISILGDGEIAILGQNLVNVSPSGEGEGGGDDDEEVGRKVRRMARALEVVGDLGVWVEWLRREFG